VTPALSSDHVMQPTVQIRCWGELCVAYSVHSGDSHLISPLAAQVLLAAQEGGSDLDAMAESIAEKLGISPCGEFLSHLHTVQAELQGKGLLKRSCCSPN
jgi:PqqD family protein of HPr-rel-A system